MKITEKDIKKFHSFESLNNLDDLNYKGKNLWPVIRYAVFYYIISDHYIYKNNKKAARKLNSFYGLIKSLKSFRYFFKQWGFKQ